MVEILQLQTQFHHCKAQIRKCKYWNSLSEKDTNETNSRKQENLYIILFMQVQLWLCKIHSTNDFISKTTIRVVESDIVTTVSTYCIILKLIFYRFATIPIIGSSTLFRNTSFMYMLLVCISYNDMLT